MSAIVDGRRLPLERDRAARFEDRALDLAERRKALFAGRGFKLMHRDEFALDVSHVELAVLDEDVGLAFDEVLQPAVVVKQAVDAVVEDEERDCTDDAA